MKLVPYLRNNELRPMSNMLSLFDDFFNRVYEDESSDDNFRAMAMDIVELDKEFQIMANLPGLKKRVAVSNPLFSIKTNRTGLMRHKVTISGFIAFGCIFAPVRILLYSSFVLKLSLHTPCSDLEVTKVTARSLQGV